MHWFPWGVSVGRLTEWCGNSTEVLFGVGCPHPAIECLASQTTKMLTHYGCETAVGCLLQPSVALLILELGMGSQPFTVDFLKCGAWVTDSWVKSLWEKVFIFGITLEEGHQKICPPRE
jgi:hypothetical protein